MKSQDKIELDDLVAKLKNPAKSDVFVRGVMERIEAGREQLFPGLVNWVTSFSLTLILAVSLGYNQLGSVSNVNLVFENGAKNNRELTSELDGLTAYFSDEIEFLEEDDLFELDYWS